LRATGLKIAVLAVIWLLTLLGLYLLGRHWTTRRRSRERVLEGSGPTELADPEGAEEEAGFLTRWLFRAGFRAPEAPRIFVGATALCAGLGLLGAYTLYAAGLLKQAYTFAGLVPGGVGDLLLPMVMLSPWALAVILTSFPTVIVRAARRQRVNRVEQDLPITLELLATLSEAGLGFDAALERILQAQPGGRPLTQEFRTFQMEILAGRPRIQCLRRLARRVDVMSLTIFVSALVQTEQVGAGMADVLRRQADDLRGRRRENALALAAAVPVKLLFPLVICFLPGVLVATLGPTFYQIFQFLDNLNRNRGLP
jgi:tight adherence protein C